MSTSPADVFFLPEARNFLDIRRVAETEFVRLAAAPPKTLEKKEERVTGFCGTLPISVVDFGDPNEEDEKNSSSSSTKTNDA